MNRESSILNPMRSSRVSKLPNRMKQMSMLLICGLFAVGALLPQTLFAVNVPVNYVPNQIIQINEGDTATLTLPAADLTNPYDPLTLHIEPAPAPQVAAGNSVAVNANDTISYAPAANYYGTDRFEYSVCKILDANDCLNRTVTMQVAGQNDPPAATDDTYTIDEGETLDTANDLPAGTAPHPSVLDNDTDPDNLDPNNPVDTQTATYVVTSGPSHGQLTGGYSVEICEDAGGAGTCQTYTASMAQLGALDNEASYIEVVAPPGGMVTFYGAPNFTGTTWQVPAGIYDWAQINVSPVGNDDISSFSLMPFFFADGNFVYTPDQNFVGTDSFEYTVTDALGATDTGTVFINVLEVGDLDQVTLNVVPDPTDEIFFGGNPPNYMGTFGVEMDTQWEPVTSIEFRLQHDACLLFGPGDITLNPQLNGHLFSQLLQPGLDPLLNEQWIDVLLVLDQPVPNPPYDSFTSLLNPVDGVIDLFSVDFTYDDVNCSTADWSVPFTFEGETGSFVDASAGDPVPNVVGPNDAVDLNFNEVPTDIGLTNQSIMENNSISDVIGDLSTTDADNPLDSHTYALNDLCVTNAPYGDNAAFMIMVDPILGPQLLANKVFDFEDPTRIAPLAPGTYNICIETTDTGGSTYSEEFAITITDDTLEKPTGVLIDDDETDSIAEASAINTVVGLLTPEGDQTGPHTYMIVDGDPNGDFIIGGVNGDELQTNKVLDYETGPQQYTLKIKISDTSFTPAMDVEDTITIDVTNVDEPPTGISPMILYALAQQGPNTLVGILSATGDPDTDDGNNHNFSLVNPGAVCGTDAFATNNNNLFGIGMTDGKVTDNGNLPVPDATPPADGIDEYYICVRAADADNAALYVDKMITIKVTHGNDAPTAIDDDLDAQNLIVVGNEIWGLVSGVLTKISDGFDVRANDTDPENDALFVNSVQNPADNGGGTAIINSAAEIQYTAPGGSFGGTDTFEYDVQDIWGSVSNMAEVNLTYVAGHAPGDCNGDGSLSAADIQAFANEIWDEDQHPFNTTPVAWYEIFAQFGTDPNAFPGSPFGCEITGISSVSISDLICAAPAYFPGGDVCTAVNPVMASSANATILSIGAMNSPAAGDTLQVPVQLTGSGNSVLGIQFDLTFDAALFSFNDADADADGIPDALTLSVPEGIEAAVRYDATNSSVQVILYSFTIPSTALNDGTIATMELQVSNSLDVASSTIGFVNVDMSAANGQTVDFTASDQTVNFAGVTGSADLDSFLFLPLTQN